MPDPARERARPSLKIKADIVDLDDELVIVETPELEDVLMKMPARAVVLTLALTLVNDGAALLNAWLLPWKHGET